MLKGRSDSPMWKRGNFSRSNTITRRPARASKVAAVLPAGPPPMIATSYMSLLICVERYQIIRILTGAARRLQQLVLTSAWKMKLIDRFISRELIVNVLFAIAVLSLVLVVGNIFRKLLPLLINHDVPMETLFTFIAYVMPFSLIFTIPWGLLTAILLVFGRLSADNELIALRANGVRVP